MPSIPVTRRDPRRTFARLLTLWALHAGAASGAEAEHWTPKALRSDEYESSPAFTPDGREMFLMRADRSFANYRLLHSRCTATGWSAPQPAPFAAPAPALEADPFVTPDGVSVYFVSSRHDPEHEDLDIWRVRRDAGDRWSEPERLPAPVNSPHSELLPRVARSGALYFGSSRPGGFGASDIYLAREDADGDWHVWNFGAPVSTAANEYEAEISADERRLVVVADRGDRSHLYLYEREASRWRETSRIDADPEVFQVGPLLSPRGDRLLFAQAQGERSGELFLLDIAPDVDRSWPPRCEPAQTRALD
jgi:Tol biopolymer transport system component